MLIKSNQKAIFRILPFLQPDPDGRQIDIDQIKNICANGLSDSPTEDRAGAWLALLDIFPRYAVQWQSQMELMFHNYSKLISQNELEQFHKEEIPINACIEDFSVSKPKLMHEIHGDITRSGRYLQFFPESDNSSSFSDLVNSKLLTQYNEHIRRIERILYIFCSIHFSFDYMQGFNELIMPLYYVMNTGKDLFNNDSDVAEAVIYFSFQQLVVSSSLLEFYTSAKKPHAIIQKLDGYQKLLDKHLPKMSNTIKQLQITPIEYCYRWFSLLFSQEFELPSLLVVWDSILSHAPHIIDFSNYIAVSHMEMIKEQIIPSNACTTLSILQNFDESKRLLLLIKNAHELWDADHAPQKKKRRFSKK